MITTFHHTSGDYQHSHSFKITRLAGNKVRATLINYSFSGVENNEAKGDGVLHWSDDYERNDLAGSMDFIPPLYGHEMDEIKDHLQGHYGVEEVEFVF